MTEQDIHNKMISDQGCSNLKLRKTETLVERRCRKLCESFACAAAKDRESNLLHFHHSEFLWSRSIR